MRNKSILPFVFVMLIAMAVRLPLLYYFDVVAPDGVVLIEMAKTLATGDFFTTNIPEHHHEPLYPALIAAVSAVTPLEYVKSGQITSLVSAMAAIYLVYRLAARLYGRESGIYSALILSLVPLHAFSSVMVLKESLYVLLVVALIYSCALAMECGGKAHFVMTGLFLGLAYLARFDGILLLLIIPFLCYAVDAGAFPGKRVCILLVSAAAFVLYAAYASVLYFQTGEVTISKKLDYYVSPVMAADAAKKKLIRDYGHEKGEEMIKTGSEWRGFLLKRTEGLYKGAHYMLPSVFPVLLMLLAGVALGAFEFGKTEMLLLIVPIIYLFVFPYMKYPNDYRYFLCVTPFLSIFAGKGLALLQHGLAERHRYLPRVFIIVFLVVFAPWVFKPVFDGTTWRDVLLQKEIGLYIRDRHEANKARVVSSYSVISFYANAVHIPLGSIVEGGVVKQLEKIRADYIVISDPALRKELEKSYKDLPYGYELEEIKEFVGMGSESVNVMRVINKKM